MTEGMLRYEAINRRDGITGGRTYSHAPQGRRDALYTCVSLTLLTLLVAHPMKC